MADQQRMVLMGQVAQLYYEQGATQETIAGQLKLSRPTVSRLLKEAREEGIVQITIRSPLGYAPELETALLRAFPRLRQAVVAAGGAGLAEPLLRRNLGKAAADYLLGALRDGDTLGVTWGHTMAEVAACLEPRPLRRVTVVQLNGGVSRAGDGTNAGAVVQRFGRVLGAAAHFLPVPAIVDDSGVAEALRSERHVRRLLEMGLRANVAIYGVGVPAPESTLLQAGYFTPADLERLRRRGAAGDICSRYFTATGEVADPDLEARTIGVPLAALAAKERSVAVAGGLHKVQAIRAAVLGGFTNVLVTDDATARALLGQGPGVPPPAPDPGEGTV